MNKKRTNIYLDEVDYRAIAVIKEHYNLTSDSAAIRLALSLQAMQIQEKKSKKGKS